MLFFAPQSEKEHTKAKIKRFEVLKTYFATVTFSLICSSATG